MKKPKKIVCGSEDYSTTTLERFLYFSDCIPSGWEEFFKKPEVKTAVQIISAELEKQTKTDKLQFNPKLGWVFRALDMVAPDKIKVVILGQDPTPQPGKATGLAFSLQPTEDAREVATVFNVLMELKLEGFHTNLKNGDLTPWVAQGVFLLNSALTVPHSQAGAHLSLWKPFMRLLITYISEKASSSAWMVWGKLAVEILKPKKNKPVYNGVDTKKHYQIIGNHPSAAYAAYVYFLGGDYFKCANTFLTKVKRDTINWDLPGLGTITSPCPPFP